MAAKLERKRRGPYRRYLFDDSVAVPKTTRRRVSHEHEQDHQFLDDMNVSDSPPADAHVDDWTRLRLSADDEENSDGTDLEDNDPSSEDEYMSEDDTEDSGNNKETSEETSYLYEGCRLTLAMSMILILTFVTRHDLTGAALKDLLVLIELHCAVPNIFRETYKLYNQFFLNLKGPVEFHYFCCFCDSYFGVTKPEICKNCQSEDSNIQYFIYLPIIIQLNNLFKRQGFIDLIKYPQEKTSANIEDVYSGKWYKTQFKDGYFKDFTGDKGSQTHISFQLNTDGVSLFKSSTYSVWPVYLIINELPPHLRYTSKNRIFAGLWFGKTKPKMNVFLSPLVSELLDLYNKGLKISSPLCNTTVRCLLLSTVCDAPARCCLQNFVQFNGYNGCPFCGIRGETVKTTKGGSTMTYPYDCNNPSVGHPEKRTHYQTLINAREAVKTGKSVNGVKGFSVLCQLPYFDIIKSTCIDYMHLMLLGITKMFIHLWTDSSSNGEEYYLGTNIDIVNNRISQIKPPKQLTRIPRSLNDISNWKASEYKNFLLYFSIPCLWGVLPKKYFVHWILFVESCYILLKCSILPKELEKARLSLCKFSATMDTLYLQRNMLSNVHGLLHLCEKVEELGPLWSQSCFFYEDLNGDLRKLFHGTQNIESQIITAVQMQQNLSSLLENFEHGSKAESLYKRMTNSREHLNKTLIKGNLFFIGNSNEILLGRELSNLFPSSVFYDKYYQFYRMLKGKVMIHSKSYTAVSKRDTTCIIYNQGKSYGSIDYFVKCVNDNSVDYFAVIHTFEPVPIDFEYKLPMHVKIFSESAKRAVIPVEQIENPCVCIKFNEMSFLFCALFPNMIEKD